MRADLPRDPRSFVGISLPQPFERFRKGLLFHIAIDMAGIAGKHKLIAIPFGGESSCHVLAGNDPVVHAVAHDIWIEKISISDFHPDPKDRKSTRLNSSHMSISYAV